MKEKSFDWLKEQILFHKITSWNDEESTITLDNGLTLAIEETEHDCCAGAWGLFENVVLDAAITDISDIIYEPWEDDDTYGCYASVTIMHNKNIICKANAKADAGNGGYYYSIASFIVTPLKGKSSKVYFVGSGDGL